MTKRAAKCLFEEVDNFEVVEKGMPSANVYGVLTSVSSMKKGRQNYFKGKVSDGNSKLQFVKFNSKQQKNVRDAAEKTGNRNQKLKSSLLDGENRWRYC